MVINVPIPRAINLGFLGLILTRLIAHHLLGFPPALTAVFSTVVRSISSIRLHYQPEDGACIIDFHILATLGRVRGGEKQTVLLRK